jgi:hypothetical protein
MLAVLVALAVVGCTKKTEKVRTLENTTGDARLNLTVTHGPLVAHQPVVWQLVFSNVSAQNVQITFRTAQRGEVVLLDKSHNNKVVYQWSKGRSFTQSLATSTIGPRKKLAITLEGTLDVAAGTYQLRAGMASTPAPTPVFVEVTVRK